MSTVESVNQIKTRRTELLRQLEDLMKLRAQRNTYISSDLNRKIHKLEERIHKLTLEHRDEIKKCYSGSKTPIT